MRPFTTVVDATAGGFTYSKPFVVDIWANPTDIGIGITGTNSAVYTVQHTFSDPFSVDLGNPANGVWINNTAVSAAIGNNVTNYAFPPTAIRLALASAASARATMTVIQAGPEN